MKVNDFGKLILLGVGIICITLLMLFHDIAESSAVAFYTLIFGYLLGNGKVAVSGKSPSPVIVPTDDKAIEQLHKVAEAATVSLASSGEVPEVQ